MSKAEKTNVMRLLEQMKIPYQAHSYEPDTTLTGQEIARLLGEREERVFKTLVTQGKSQQYYVFIVPVEAELNLKKAADAAGEKAISMIPQKELYPLTGYVHGGCSPIGMKKRFPTFLHRTAEEGETICVSGGKPGFQVELAPEALIRAAGCTLADLV